MWHRVLFLLGAAAALGAGAAWLLIDPVVAAIYDERAPALLNRAISGRGVHEAGFYQDLVREQFGQLLAVTFVAGLIALLAPLIARRSAVAPRGNDADLSAQRLRLVGTCVGVAGVVGLVVMQVEPSGVMTPGVMTPGGAGAVVISEVMSSNASVVSDEDGDHPDWIELHNPGERPVDLEGYYLTDDPDGDDRWPMPAVRLPPGEQLLIFASGKDRVSASGELHTNFRISQDGDSVLLLAPDGGTLVDRLDLASVPRDASFGRDPRDPERTCYFAVATPLEQNAPECFDGQDLGAPELSTGSGFFDEGFELSITSELPDATLIYTLDGSFPDLVTNPESTMVYDGPLTISDRNSQPNTISEIPTTLFPLLGQVRLVPDEPELDGPVPKGTVVRVRSEFGAERTATYFVGPNMVRDDLTVLSLALDADHLFDHETGIYVAGQETEDFIAGPDFDPEEVPHYWQIPANYNQRGRAWERPFQDQLRDSVVLEVCAPGGECEFQQDVGVRLHGRSSRTFTQKSIRLYARNDYGARTFEYPFFADRAPADHRRLILRNSGSEFRQPSLMFLDGYLQELMGGLAADTQAYEPAVLFINGEYWGIHNVRERYDAHYLAATHGADPAEVTILLGQGLSVGDSQVRDEFVALLDRVASADPADTEVRAELEAAIDVDSYFDFVIAHAFVGNWDWPAANVRLWRSHQDPAEARPGDGVLDGRWRWLIFDLDHMGGGAGLFDVDYDVFANRFAPTDDPQIEHGYPFLFHWLVADDELRQRFVSRFDELLDSTFDPDRTVPLLDEFETRLEDEIALHAERWGRPASVDQWREDIDRLRTFMAERPGAQREHLRGHFG